MAFRDFRETGQFYESLQLQLLFSARETKAILVTYKCKTLITLTPAFWPKKKRLKDCDEHTHSFQTAALIHEIHVIHHIYTYLQSHLIKGLYEPIPLIQKNNRIEHLTLRK